ncbi:MAG: hypothetical protein K0R65_484 [Crocinitomicaceae bacterium]|jgi:hypothetical protein|nr:hypothetical protein [Crocinitomicaceae bacterium]
MKIILLLTVSALLLATTAYSQSRIEWGEAYKREGLVEEIHWLNSNAYFVPVVHKSVSDKMDNMYTYPDFQLLSYYEGLNSVSSETANKKKGEDKFQIAKIIGLNQLPIVFLAGKEDKQHGLYYQNYTDKCVPVGSPQLLFTYEKDIMKWPAKEFKFIFSKNREFLCIQVDLQGAEYLYFIYSKNMELISKGKYKLRVDYEIKSLELTNSGELYSLSYPTKVLRTLMGRDQKIKTYDITCLNGENEGTYNLTLKNEYFIDDILLTETSSDKVIISAAYSQSFSEAKNYVAGIYYAEINVGDNRLVSEVYNAFENDFIAAGLTEKEAAKIRKSIGSGKKIPDFRKYKFREAFPHQGGLIYVMEEEIIENPKYHMGGGYSTPVYSPTAMRGAGGMSYGHTGTGGYGSYSPSKFKYNDVVIFKMSREGEIQWKQKIHKQQYSESDRGYFSSVSAFQKKDHLYLYFNDNIANYDEQGLYLNNMKKFKKTVFNSEKRVLLAEVKISLSDGAYQRASVYKTPTGEGILSPKVFKYNPAQDKILMLQYMEKKKERMAWLFPD